jgi:Golgi nucleoside diphosphatase
MKKNIPEASWQYTPVWLKATAGMRMLSKETADQILATVQDYLENEQNSPFMFKPQWAAIIPGTHEGGFGWISYNYLKKLIGPKRALTDSSTPYAVVEMGGASAQVSFFFFSSISIFIIK